MSGGFSHRTVMTTVFVYKTDTYNFMIIKRRPFDYYIRRMDPKTADVYDDIQQGYPLELPKWDTQYTDKNGNVYATLGKCTYDISDLNVA
jgi:hypothetical protein